MCIDRAAQGLRIEAACLDSLINKRWHRGPGLCSIGCPGRPAVAGCCPCMSSSPQRLPAAGGAPVAAGASDVPCMRAASLSAQLVLPKRCGAVSCSASGYACVVSFMSWGNVEGMIASRYDANRFKVNLAAATMLLLPPSSSNIARAVWGGDVPAGAGAGAAWLHDS